jgi:hypothetical protein
MRAAMMTEAPVAASPRKLVPARLIPLGRSLLINILGPYIAYRLATPWFAPDSAGPLAVSALIPAGDLLVVFLCRRSIDAIAVISLVQLGVGVLINLVSRSASLALSAHALQTGGLGLVFAVSALIGRPLIRPLARQTLAGDDPERQAQFDERSRIPAVRATFSRMSWVWAAALCTESAIRVVAVHRMQPANYLMLSSAMGYGLTAALIWGSVRYGRYRASKVIE